MANTTITNLPLAIALTGTEQLPAVQSTTTVRLTVSQIATYTSSTMAAPVVTIGGAVSGGTPGNGLYVSSSGTLGEFPYGAGIFNAIQIAAGSNGAPVLFNGAGGTPTSLTLTLGSISVSGATNGYLLYNNGGLLGAVAPTAASLSIGSPITGGTSGYGLYVDASNQLGQFAYGTGVRTALGVNVGSAGAPVLFNGAGGTPSSLTLTSATGLPLTTGVTGNLPVTNLNSGTGATASTFWRGDGTWSAVSGGSGTVTSVAQTFTGGIVSVGGSPITVSGTLALTVAGTSGGIPYFSSGTTWASSAALTLNGVVYGGGAGASPVSTAAGTTGQVLIATTSNAPSWGQVPLATGVTGTLPVSNGGTGQSTALTQYGVIYGSSATAMGNTAAGTTGQVLIATTSAAPSWGQVPIAGGGTGQTTTALGTIVVGASASTTTNLGIGSSGQVLTVSGGTATWQNAASGGVSTITFGSTGLTPNTATSGAVSVAGTLNAGFGGTGLATLTANSVLLGNGTSAVQLIAPSTAGNVLTSDGTTWTSTAPAAGGLTNVQIFNTSGTWTKPTTGFGANSRVFIQAWGGGGSGSKAAAASYSGGGGGGGYNEAWFYLSQFTNATETVTCGAGGTAITAAITNGNVGSNTTIGSPSYITAYGGGGGFRSNTVNGAIGGGGGGQISAGSSSGVPGSPTLGAVSGCAIFYPPGTGASIGSGSGIDGFAHGGGGSGGGVSFVAGKSVWGGGGGGSVNGSTLGAAGTSVWGGNGGAASVAGTATTGVAPGGGGGSTNTGTSGAGGIGRMIITVFPN